MNDLEKFISSFVSNTRGIVSYTIVGSGSVQIFVDYKLNNTYLERKLELLQMIIKSYHPEASISVGPYDGNYYGLLGGMVQAPSPVVSTVYGI